MNSCEATSYVKNKIYKSINNHFDILTIYMSESTKDSSGAVASLLHIITLGALVYLRMKLLLGPSVTISTQVSCFTVTGLSPLISVLHIRTWS